MIGCPLIIGGDFECNRNRLTSLEGCPVEVLGKFNCSNNELTSLEGCPVVLPVEHEYQFNCSCNIDQSDQLYNHTKTFQIQLIYSKYTENHLQL